MKKLLAVVLAAFMSLSLVTAAVADTPQTGDGTPGSPLQIGTEAELLAFATRVAGGEMDLCAILTSDIEVEEWDIIGGTERKSSNYSTTSAADSLTPYAGTFDGGGHTLTLSENRTNETTWAGSGIALFHTIDTNGIVRNLNLEVQFQGYSFIGGVAVKNYGTIERVTVDGNIKAGRLNSDFTGGIAAWSGTKTIDGEVVPGKILYCVNKADIDTTVNASSATYNTEKGGGAQMGGICGAFLGEMRYCVNLGAIWANNQAGALFCLPATIPASRELLVVSDCYNAGEIKLTNTATLNGSGGLGGLFGGRHDQIISWAEYEGVYEITNVFNFGGISRAFELSNYNPNNTGPGAVGYISSALTSAYLDYHAAAIFSNIYYRNDVPTILFSAGDLNGDADENGKKFGTFRIKNVIHAKTADEFKTAELAVLLNNGRRGADAPWEYVEGNDYPTLKFENTSGTPGIDYIPVALDIIVDFGYGGVIATAEGDIEQCTVAATAEGYVIDTIGVDGVRLENVQGLTEYTTTISPETAIFATFAYTLNFQTPANGTLSVSRGAQTLTSGSIVRAGETLTITATANSGYALDRLTVNGLENTTAGGYKVTALRDQPPSIEAAFKTPTVYAPIDTPSGTGAETKTDDAATVGDAALGVPPAAPSVIATESVTAAAAVDPGTGKAVSEVSSGTVAEAVADAAKAVADAKTSGDANAIAEVKIIAKAETAETVKSAEVNIPAEAVKAVAEAKDLILTIESDVSTVTLDTATLTAIAEAAKAGETIKIAAETVDTTVSLNERQREKVGDNPVIEVNITVGTTAITNLGGTVTVSVPYTPPATVAESDQDLLTVYYLDDDGNITEMKGAKYDAATGKITFATTHFSKFLISEWINPFTDIAKGEWYYKAARYAYSNALITGTTDTTFAPQATLTRAMLATILYRNTVGGGVHTAPPPPETPFTDVVSNQWYTPAIAWASSNGLITGVGNNKFAPNDPITREQFATLLYRYTQWSDAGNGTPRAASPTDANLSAYTDVANISDWAQEAMAWVVSTGLITGRTETTLAPEISATRAEAAMLLQRCLETIT